MMYMPLEEAIARLEEIAEGDKEREAFDTLVFACEQYRALYEGAQKRLMYLRDVAGRPDLQENVNAVEGVMKDKYKIDPGSV